MSQTQAVPVAPVQAPVAPRAVDVPRQDVPTVEPRRQQRGADAFADSRQPSPQTTAAELTDARRFDAVPSAPTGPDNTRTRPAPRGETQSGSGGGKFWRQLSVLGCLAGVVVVGIWLRQGLAATPNQGDSATGQAVTATDTSEAQPETGAETSIPLPLNNTEAPVEATEGAPPSDPFNGTITVADFAITDTMQVGVLGSDIRTPITPDAATVDVATPAGIATIIGLWEGEAFRGMTIVNQPGGAAGPDQNTISPATTAQSLVALFPGVLTNDVAGALNRSAALVDTGEFAQLADAIRDRGGVIIDTPDIAIALSGAVNALPPLETLDPSCGTNAPNTVASAGGVCFSSDDPPVITNETSRWTIVLDASSKTFICGAVAPKGQAKSVVGDNCGTEQLVVGPGPLSTGSEIDDNDRRAVRGVSGLHSFAEYGLVLNDLIFGKSSRSDEANDAAIIAIAPDVVERAVSLTDADAELAEKGLVMGAVDAHADVRVGAIIALARAMMFSDAPAMVGQESWNDSSFAVKLIDLYAQSTEWVSRSAPIPSWSVPAESVVDVTGAGSSADGNGGTDTAGGGDNTAEGGTDSAGGGADDGAGDAEGSGDSGDSGATDGSTDGGTGDGGTGGDGTGGDGTGGDGTAGDGSEDGTGGDGQ